MLINGIDIENYNATLLDYSIENSEIITSDFWAEGSLTPAEPKQTIKYSYVNVELLIKEVNNDEAEKQISKIIALSAKAELKFKKRSMMHKGTLKTHEKELITQGHYSLSLVFMCQTLFEPEVVANFTNSISIDLESTAKTPVIMELIPTENIAELTITGLGEEIKIKNLVKDSVVIIDAVKGLVTESNKNKWPDYDSWGFPQLIPGINNITVSSNKVNITLKYSPRWI